MKESEDKSGTKPPKKLCEDKRMEEKKRNETVRSETKTEEEVWIKIIERGRKTGIYESVLVQII